jgi:signal transduction histidine kinase
MFLVLLLVLFVFASVANYFGTSSSMHQQTEKELIEKGRVLSQQMNAVWSFMSANQDQLQSIARTEEGVYYGLHCAIVGRSIGAIFSQETNYTTRFVNFSPRNLADTPDDFESAALQAFKADSGVKEFYAFSEYGGMEVFRYSAPMEIQETCLECHGMPAGEIDVTGFPKEGWNKGEIGGAISIAIPLDVYRENERATVLYNLLFFSCLLLVFSVCVWIALSYLVTNPLRRLRHGIRQTQVGELDLRLAPGEASYEMRDLVQEFNEMSHKLGRVYTSLESQVLERTQQLSQANRLLEEQRSQLEEINSHLADENRYKSDFLAMMSHELRTPLTSIIAFANLLQKSASGQADPGIAEISHEIESNSQILLAIVNDILDMSRIEAGKAELNPEMVDFGDLASSLRDFVQPIADQKGIKVSYEVKNNVPLAFVDFDKLHHILVNLLSNAIKFTPCGGQVWVDISYEPVDATPTQTSSEPVDATPGPTGDTPTQPAGGFILLCVRDTGIGIAEKDLRDIFERFWQIDSSASRNYNGTGLGLALVKEYTTMHEGTVEVSSTLGEGSTFMVRIPRRQEGTE